jgi:hypothetical protein
VPVVGELEAAQFQHLSLGRIVSVNARALLCRYFWNPHASCLFSMVLPMTSQAKYSNVPMGFADACLVRMTETLADPIILTTNQDFRVYRRHSR